MTASADAPQVNKCSCEIEYDLDWEGRCVGQIVKCDHCKSAPTDALLVAQIRVRALMPNTDRQDTMSLEAQLGYSLGVLDSIKAITMLEREIKREEAAADA